MITTEITKYGSLVFYNDKGQVHRDILPAYIQSDGLVAWYQNGKLHRLDGAALECGGLYKEEYFKELHGFYTRGNENYVFNKKMWFINDKRINVQSQKEFEIYLRFRAFI